MWISAAPDATIDAFLDHGVLARTIDADPQGAASVLHSLPKVGVDLADVARVLEDEGVAAFVKSFDELMQSLEDKAATLQ